MDIRAEDNPFEHGNIPLYMKYPKATGQKRLQRHFFYAAIIMIVTIIAGYNDILPVFRRYLKDYPAIGDARF